MTEQSIPEWVEGDRFGLALPSRSPGLREGGAEFLTRAFHATGALAPANRVRAITRLDEWSVGGTGAKAMVSVSYEREEPGLVHDLFVKFSRNFTDRTRDRVRFHMEPEVKLANLSRDPAFPVPVPRCLFADFEHASGTGIIITERIPFGEGAVEPHHLKCMDQRLPEPLDHYRTLIATLAHLSGTHKAGRLGAAAERDFPFDREATIVDRRNPFDTEQLTMRVERLVNFIRQYPHLFPANIAEPGFLATFTADAPRVVAQQDAISRHQLANSDMIALCHWNGNIDNAWFWREQDGELRCGLIDWGSVGQMHVAQTIWGCLSACEPDFIDANLPALIDLFTTEYARSGGPALDPRLLEQELELHIMTNSLRSLMIAPRAILSEVPDPSQVADRYDPIFTVNETARVMVKVTTNFLNFWQRRDLGRWLRSGQFETEPEPAT